MSIYYQDESVTLLHGDALEQARTLPDGSVDCIVTSPPYFGLRDYGNDGQYGNEGTPGQYVETLRSLFSELRRALADDGTMWLNLGDSYNTHPQRPSLSATSAQVPQSPSYPSPAESESGSPHSPHVSSPSLMRSMPMKNLLGMPWRVAFSLQDDGWILRNSIIWRKPNGMPESVTDRLSNRYENIFMFSKSERYWFDLDPIRQEQSPESIARRKRGDSRTKSGWADAYKGNPPKGLARQSTRDVSKGSNPGDVWDVPTKHFAGAHFAVFPPEIPRRAIVSGCKPGGTVLDPFSGSGTTGLMAGENGRKYIGIDISEDYLKLSLETRLQTGTLNLGAIAHA